MGFIEDKNYIVPGPVFPRYTNSAWSDPSQGLNDKYYIMMIHTNHEAYSKNTYTKLRIEYEKKQRIKTTFSRRTRHT